MFFCDKCRYLFNVTKDVKNKQIGGKINEALNKLFEKFKTNKEITERDLKNIKANDVQEDERFELMNKKEQRKLISVIKAVDKNFFSEPDEPENESVGANIAYFICKFCKNSKPIKPGTIIYTKKYQTSTSTEDIDYTYAIHDQTLARTRNYICPNEKCETHSDSSLKEAVLTKNSNDQIVYICTVCNKNWIHTV